MMVKTVEENETSKAAAMIQSSSPSALLTQAFDTSRNNINTEVIVTVTAVTVTITFERLSCDSLQILAWTLAVTVHL